MHAGDGLPRVAETAGLRDTMLEIMGKRLGITTVVDAGGRLAGVITDGDFKRILLRHTDPWDLTAADVMTRNAATIDRNALVAAAVRAMEDRSMGAITSLIVLDDRGRPEGVLHLHDCLRAGA
jgi:arabinose-5-phosphate isomerase